MTFGKLIHWDENKMVGVIEDRFSKELLGFRVSIDHLVLKEGMTMTFTKGATGVALDVESSSAGFDRFCPRIDREAVTTVSDLEEKPVLVFELDEEAA